MEGTFSGSTSPSSTEDLTFVACAIMTSVQIRANRRLRSDFIALDVKAWIMSGAITAALLIAFMLGYADQGTPLDWLCPYVDPAVLAAVSIVIIPIPIGTVRQALSDIFLIAPADLKAHVDRVAADTVDHGFQSYRAYVAKVGRAMQAELYFIVPKNLPARTIEEWDSIRDEVGAAIGVRAKIGG